MKKRNRRKSSVAFKPDRKAIEEAMKRFLEHGGKITHCEYDPSEYDEFMKRTSGNDETDSFLIGE